MAKKIRRTNDLAFKKAFTTEGNADSLIGLAKDILGIEITALAVKQPYSIESYIKMVNENQFAAFQQTIKDISAKVQLNYKGANLISELQVRETKNFLERSLYYPAQTFTEDYKSGKYQSLVPLYAINILGFNMFAQDNDGLREFEFWDRAHNEGFPIDFKIAYFEYTKPIPDSSNLAYWRNYFMDEAIPDGAPDYIKRAASVLDYANLRKEEQEMADLIEKFEADRQAREDFVYEQGIEQGIDKERIFSINTMVGFGVPLENIAVRYNMTVDQVNKLLNVRAG